MHNLPIDYIAACLLIFAVLQGLSIFLTNLQIAARQIESHSTWTAPDGTVFEEASLEEIEHSQVMLHDYEQNHTGSFGPVQLTPHTNG
jgi:hypothetical protein